MLESHSFASATAALAAIFGILIALFRMAGAPWLVLVFGLAIALFLRAVHRLLRNPAAGAGVVLACFGLFGTILFGLASMGSWLVMGAGYFAMTHLAARIDRAVFRKLEYL